jgi:hypothetical protein
MLKLEIYCFSTWLHGGYIVLQRGYWWLCAVLGRKQGSRVHGGHTPAYIVVIAWLLDGYGGYRCRMPKLERYCFSTWLYRG